jgi:hypothetical protein
MAPQNLIKFVLHSMLRSGVAADISTMTTALFDAPYPCSL